MENYFNYFTEIEECFQRCRGTRILLSPLDWALIESWKEAGVPLGAVVAGIERSFEKFRRRPKAYRKVNSLAYCTPEVLRAAEDESASGSARADGARPRPPTEAPFSAEEIGKFLNRNAAALEAAGRLAGEAGQPVLVGDFSEAVAALLALAASDPSHATLDLEELERHLTALEEKLAASLTRASSVELLAQLRGEIDRGLASFRRKMSAAQVESLERQFLKKRLFEHYRIPRLSLFYL